MAIGMQVVLICWPCCALVSLLHHFQFMACLVQLNSNVFQFGLQFAVGLFQFVALVQALRAAVLCIAAILQCASFLLELGDFLARTTMQTFVQFAHRQRCQQFVGNDLFVGRRVITADRTAGIVLVRLAR